MSFVTVKALARENFPRKIGVGSRKRRYAPSYTQVHMYTEYILFRDSISICSKWRKLLVKLFGAKTDLIFNSSPTGWG